MEKRSRAYNMIRCSFLLGVMSVLMGCSPAMDTQAKHKSKTKEDAMRLAYETEIESLEIPPIDAAASLNFETASFGLG